MRTLKCASVKHYEVDKEPLTSQTFVEHSVQVLIDIIGSHTLRYDRGFQYISVLDFAVSIALIMKLNMAPCCYNWKLAD